MILKSFPWCKSKNWGKCVSKSLQPCQSWQIAVSSAATPATSQSRSIWDQNDRPIALERFQKLYKGESVQQTSKEQPKNWTLSVGSFDIEEQISFIHSINSVSFCYVVMTHDNDLMWDFSSRPWHHSAKEVSSLKMASRQFSSQSHSPQISNAPLKSLFLKPKLNICWTAVRLYTHFWQECNPSLICFFVIVCTQSIAIICQILPWPPLSNPFRRGQLQFSELDRQI